MGLGCVGMSEFYGATDEPLVGQRAVHVRGVQEVYDELQSPVGGGLCLQLVGRARAGRRDEMVLAAKWLFHQVQDTVPIPAPSAASTWRRTPKPPG